MAKKRTIWGNLDIDFDEWEADYKEYCELNDIEYSEDGLYPWVYETLNMYIEDERCNLKKDVDGVIVVFGVIGTWMGTVNGAKTCGTKVSDILSDSNCDYAEWYCDRYNVRFNGVHHDGRNRYLYRVAKDEDTARRLVDKIAYHDMTEEQFMKATKSLRPYVAKVYGW
jgi:hypothetical protein